MAFNFKCKVPKVLKSVRYSLAAVNGAFLLTGLLLFFVGIAVLVEYKNWEVLITGRFFALSKFVVATGAIILFGSVLGFYAAISQHFYFVAGSIFQYVVLLLVTLVFEIAIAIAAFSLSNDAVKEIRPSMVASLNLYNERLDITKLWDDMQMEYECCGVVGRPDWVMDKLPVSCCHMDYGTLSPFTCEIGNAYVTGCASVLGEWLAYNAHVLGVVAIVATCVQILLTSMGGYLAYRAKFSEVELES
ncbi:tetraspanin-9-like isoform X2 [Trichoplusia ni]|uniref:Tetraspanin n=1 Tax=Trichoplusia ni TaxID=7111 RepID=A0A7E5WQH0_TRINI|nr:tetraspanin-9-like isoform X2 [Trichoplusia ni]